MNEMKTLGNIPLFLCALFYAVLCVFSIVTGLIYLSGRRELNPLELSDSFLQKLDTAEKRSAFARKMGGVTFLVGIVQGLTAAAILKAGSPGNYLLAIGFTLFSLASVSWKLKGKINAFPLLKLAAYLLILFILLRGSSRQLFF